MNAVDDHTSVILTIVGDSGYVARNTGGNFVFGQVASGTTEDLFAVRAIQGGEALVAGAHGTLLRSTDEGLS